MVQRVTFFRSVCAVAMAIAAAVISLLTVLPALAAATSDGQVRRRNQKTLENMLPSSFFFWPIGVSLTFAIIINSAIRRPLLLGAVLPAVPSWRHRQLRFRQFD